jgi:hypothetical protein
MNVFIKGVPANATEKEVTNFLSPALKGCGIDFFQLDKFRAKDMAILTVPTVEDGLRFLGRYGASFNLRLRWQNQTISCKPAHEPPSDLVVRSLAYEGAKASKSTKPAAPSSRDHAKHTITDVRCGSWTHTKSSAGNPSRLAFVSHHLESRDGTGTITLGRKAAIVVLGASGLNPVRMDINYADCASITVGSSKDPSISFELYFPPKFYSVSAIPQALELSMQHLTLTAATQSRRKNDDKKVRQSCLSSAHAHIVGSCFVYRVNLVDPRRLSTVLHVLKQNTRGPSVHAITTSMFKPTETYQASFTRLKHHLTDTKLFGDLPFGILYQIERLAQNGLLHPTEVLHLLPTIRQNYISHDLNATIAAIRRLYREMPLPGPGDEVPQASKRVALLNEFASSYDPIAPENVYELSKRHSHINLVHRIVVTPTRIHLEGPEPEPTNRVLRQYYKDGQHFLRVVFQEEDGGTFRYDPAASQKTIYRRFKQVLTGTINVAGRGFSFLGFSHSSLRNQACWFMAPILIDGSLCFAPQIIKQLGNFSHFRCPAKCAARIGQNFTDTNATIDVSPGGVGELAIVERNGRDFSDGVGTISHDLLRRVWRVYGSKRFIRPTALQIRFQGAKGMVSLDTRLAGEQLMLRSNMKKFETSTTWNLEICGAAFQPLPMILNRQFIKILEDLGIPLATFQKLQDAAVGRLRRMITSAPNAAAFLDQARSASRISSLIRLFHELGINFHEDNFISVILEAIVLTKLRDVKYRGRIPIEKGCTLYGIMDETGHLQEGQVYIVTEHAEHGKQIIVEKQVVVTRSPALHPGDVQIARAVDVPRSSPLNALSNVVVFSQFGFRDLPSQLSGGDLDGDLYNIIYDSDLIPKTTCQAADYPRVSAISLDREVKAEDMSDFFVDFMETDQLGYIANLHLQIADQDPLGTLSERCIRLAGMASTAVDFSKTGIPVDLKELPKFDRYKPDFMVILFRSLLPCVHRLTNYIGPKPTGIRLRRRPSRPGRTRRPWARRCT